MTDDTCTECLRDADHLTELLGDHWLCRECLWAAAEHARDMREMADDDRAHAMHYKQWLRHRLSGDDEGMMQASQRIDALNAEMDQNNRFVRDEV